MLWSLEPQQKPAHISITLDQAPNRQFLPGSRVSGTVMLTVPSTTHIVRAEAVLFGHAHTHARESEENHATHRRDMIDYEDDTSLFQLSTLLTENTTIVPAQVYEWRFDFQFPYRAHRHGESPYAGRRGVRDLYAEYDHDLPPSFAMVVGPTTFAIVECNVQAAFQFAKDEQLKVEQLANPLNLVPPSPGLVPPRLVESVKPSQRYASSRLVGGEQSLSHSLKDRLSSGTPSVNMTMKASVPTVIATGTSFPLYVCVEIDSPSASTVAVPQINLQVTKLSFCKYTFFRALRKSLHHGMSNAKESTKEEIVHLNAAPTTRVVQQQLMISEDKKIWSYPATFESRIPGSTCPSFMTYNIAHHFCFEAKVEAEICGKKFELKVDVPGVTIMPA